MPTCVRWRAGGATCFFTVITYRRQRILTGELFRSLLRGASKSVRKRLPFAIGPFVLLPDHLHCVWTLPADDDGFPERWRQIKGRFTYDYLAHGGRDYIHLNPVKHGYVVRPEDWPWSSLHRHIRLGWLDASWPGSTPIEMPNMPGE